MSHARSRIIAGAASRWRARTIRATSAQRACRAPIEPDAAAAVTLAGEASRTTHQSPLVVDACRRLAAMLCGVLQGDPQALAAQSYAPAPGFWDARPLKPEVEALRSPAARESQTLPHPDAICVLAHVREAVENSVDFEAAVRAALAQTHEPEICGALAGAFAGGLHGLRGIPAWVLDPLPRRDLLDQQLTRILVRRARTLAAVTTAQRSS
jgi:ADP-ribosyl-[dinitrogen reductase] hydrolase